MKRLPVGLTLLLILSLAISAFSVQANSALQEQDATPTPATGPQDQEGLQEQAEGLDDLFASEPGEYDQLARFSDIPGFAVYDLDGEEVGRINSVLLDQNAHIAFIVLRADYQLETDGQFIPVPWAAIDVMGRQEILDRFGNDMPAAPEATPISPVETPIVPTPGLPEPTPTQPGDAQPVTPGDNDNNNDNDGAAIPPDQIAITGQQDDQMMAQTSQWDRQFALMLNVDRQVLRDAPAFDQVLADNWEQAEWQNNLYDYWGEHTALIPETAEDRETILVQVLDVRGKRVEDQNGQLIGRVFEVILRQPSAQIAYVVVETDSRMGLNGERVAIPQVHLEMRVMAGRNVIVLTADRQMFDDAPRILTERDLMDLHRPGADQQIQQHWGTVQDVDAPPAAPDPTPVTPDQTPITPITTPENDQTPVTPITTPENDQTPIAPITTPENDQTPVATPLPPVQPVTPVETPEATPIVPEALAPIPETGVIETGFSRYSDLTGLAVFDQDGEEVGRVHSALIDRNGRLAYLVLRADSELALDGQFAAVPWGAIDVLSRQQALAFNNGAGVDVQEDDQDTPATPAQPATPATPAQPGQPGEPATPATPATPAQPAQPGNENDEGGFAHEQVQTLMRSQWDAQFVLVLNVDRQALQNAPAFNAVLVDNWDDVQWRTNLNDYWGQHTATIPQTGLGDDQDLFQILNVRGLPVEDQNGDLIGRVFEAVFRQPGDQIGYMVVETGGVFGIDTDRLAVPMEHLDVEQRNGHTVLVLTADRQLFDQAPLLQTEADMMNLQSPTTDQDQRQHWGTPGVDFDTDDNNNDDNDDS